jgi:hypothetical protein
MNERHRYVVRRSYASRLTDVGSLPVADNVGGTPQAVIGRAFPVSSRSVNPVIEAGNSRRRFTIAARCGQIAQISRAPVRHRGWSYMLCQRNGVGDAATRKPTLQLLSSIHRTLPRRASKESKSE